MAVSDFLGKMRSGLGGGGGGGPKAGEPAPSAPTPVPASPKAAEPPSDPSSEHTAPELCPDCGKDPCECKKMGEQNAPDEDPKKKDDTTMADKDNKGATTPPNTPGQQQGAAAPAPKIAAKKEELEQAFPDAGDREFRIDCREAGMSLTEAWAAYGQRQMQINKDAAAKAEEQKKAEAALGGAGISRNTGASAIGREVPGREVGAQARGAQDIEAKILAERLRDPITGKIGAITGSAAQGVKTFDDAYEVYMRAGEKPSAAYVLAQKNHPELWDAKQQALGQELGKRRLANRNKPQG